MAESQRVGLAEKDIEQAAITALKKGAYLLKYGRRGKPKFCPFHLSNDESMLIWYSDNEEKQLKLKQVSRIIPGQRTVIFQRYPRPEKEYQSFSLIYDDRSLDLICKDKDEAEVWFVGLKTLITRGSHNKWNIDTKNDNTSSDSPHARIRKTSPTVTPIDFGDTQGMQVPLENVSKSGLGKAFADLISYTEAANCSSQAESVSFAPSPLTNAFPDNSNERSSAAETFRVSLSSAVSSSSHGSCHEGFDSLGDAFIWGEGIANGFLGGGEHRVGYTFSPATDALLPKAVESTVVLNVHNIACGARHAALITKQGEIFSWGEESGGRLGHGIEADVSHPKLIKTLSGVNVELVACGEYHTCAVTLSGDLYTWGDGTYNSGVLGHGSKVSHWIPRKMSGDMDGIRVSYISCGLWHTALVTSAGQLFTFGDGSFGALGHGDHISTSIPQEVETLRGLRTTRVSCGVWHTAAVVQVLTESSSSSPSQSPSSGKLFTWGDGDKGRLGHGDKEPRLFPECVAPLINENICQVACGHNLSVALTTSGHVYTMGSTAYGQLGIPTADGLVPTRVEGIIKSCVEEIACGAYHVAALTSSSLVYTWGKGANGKLGHGDKDDRHSPTLVDFLKDKLVKLVACGSNFTAIICLHKWVSSVDHSVCSSFRNPFGFRRKRHNCYNCGLVFCKACSSRKFSLNQEIIKLRAQVEELTSKSQHLEAELQRTSKQLKTVTAIAEDGAEKCKSAKEVIKSLTSQLKEMAEKTPKGESTSFTSGTAVKHPSSVQNTSSTESPKTRTAAPESESNSNSTNRNSSHGTKAQTEKKEQMVQAEPGVYITLTSLPGGAHELKRVRFSRKRFSEPEAEKWWAENESKVSEQYIIRSSN